MSEPTTPVSSQAVSEPWHKWSRTKWAIIGVLLLVALGMWRCGQSASAGTKAAKQAVLRFHQHFNQNQYHDIYAEATAVFRSAGSESETSAFLDKVHEKLGDEVSNGEPTYFANVSTRGTFVTLTYNSEFTHGRGQERFVWRIEGDQAQLVRYDINSKDLIMK